MARRKPEKPKKAGFKNRDTVIAAICTVIREDWRAGVTPTLLNHEGTLQASLRSAMCLRGVGWRVADEAAREAVQEALMRAGAKRPRWSEGQPEHCDGGVIRDTRTNCARCERWIEPPQKVYCSKQCRDAHLKWRERIENLDKFLLIERLRAKARRHNAA